MLSRVCAAWLALLILLPFSAPFSTCDLGELLGTGHGAASSGGPAHHQPSVAQQATTHAQPNVRVRLRGELLAMSIDSLGAAAIRPVARVKHRVTPVTLIASPLPTPLRI